MGLACHFPLIPRFYSRMITCQPFLLLLLLVFSRVGGIAPNLPLKTSPGDVTPSNATLPGFAALQEWINSTSVSSQQIMAGFLKWKEELGNINLTYHMESFRDLAENFNFTSPSDTPLQLIQTLSKAFDVVNQTLSIPLKPVYTVVQFADRLDLPLVQRIAMLAEGARRRGCLYHLLYLASSSASLERQQREREDVATLEGLLSPQGFTVIEDRDVERVERLLSPLSPPSPSSSFSPFTVSSDYLLVAYLLKRGYLNDSVDIAPRTNNHSHPLSCLLSPLLKLFRKEREQDFFSPPSRLFWLLPPSVQWRGEGAELLSLLERVGGEYTGESDLLLLSPRKISFGEVDRGRRNLLNFILGEKGERQSRGEKEGEGEGEGVEREEGQERGDSLSIPKESLLRISSRYVKYLLKYVGARAREEIGERGREERERETGKEQEREGSRAKEERVEERERGFHYDFKKNTVENLLLYLSCPSSPHRGKVGGLTCYDASDFAYSEGFLQRERPGRDEKGTPALLVPWERFP